MTHLQWNRALLWRLCRWWLFCGWHTCSPGEGGRAAARARCLWTLYSRAAGRRYFRGCEDTGRVCPQSRTPGWDPGRRSGHWSALSCWALRQNCRPSIPFRKQGRIWTRGCSCPGGMASGGHREESVCREKRGQRLWRESLGENNISVSGLEFGHPPGWGCTAQFAHSSRHSSPRCWKSGCWGRTAWRWDRDHSTAQIRSPCECTVRRWPLLHLLCLRCCWTPVAPESGGELCGFHLKEAFMFINRSECLGFQGHTSGSKKFLNVWFLKPFGWEMPSSYSAGSQRVKGVLADPRRGLFLKSNRRCPCLEMLLEKWHGSVHIFCGIWPKMFRSISQAFPLPHRPCFH